LIRYRSNAGRGGRRAAPPFFTALLLLSTASVCGATGSALVSVTANVLSKSIFHFDSKSLALDFGNVDPGSPADVTATGPIGFRCGGSACNATFVLVDDGGLHETGPESPKRRISRAHPPVHTTTPW
jgi:hypothetical protein